jgi:hypothetical protein
MQATVFRGALSDGDAFRAFAGPVLTGQSTAELASAKDSIFRLTHHLLTVLSVQEHETRNSAVQGDTVESVYFPDESSVCFLLQLYDGFSAIEAALADKRRADVQDTPAV